MTQGSSPSSSNTAFFDNYVNTNHEALLLDLRVGDLGASITGGNINLNLQSSEDLSIWTDAGVPEAWTLPADASKKFYRVRASEP